MFKLLVLLLALTPSVVSADGPVYVPGSASTLYDEGSIERSGDFATVRMGSTLKGDQPGIVAFDCTQLRLRTKDSGWTNISELSPSDSREAMWVRNKACRSWKHPTSWFK